MIIVSFSATKGGVGKTTLSYNYGEWLNDEGYRVLFIDNDPQSSLSQSYGIYETENSITKIYRDGQTYITHLKEGLDIIPATIDLDTVNEELQTKTQREFLLIKWYLANVDELKQRYDFIIIDNHPDFSTITKNAVMMSDFIISPVEPGEYSYISKSNLKSRFEKFQSECVDPVTNQTYLTGELLFIGNRVKHNTNSSRYFIEQINKDDDFKFKEYFKEKELFNRSTTEYESIVKMAKDSLSCSKHKEFYESTFGLFQLITDHFKEMS